MPLRLMCSTRCHQKRIQLHARRIQIEYIVRIEKKPAKKFCDGSKEHAYNTRFTQNISMAAKPGAWSYRRGELFGKVCP